MHSELRQLITARNTLISVNSTDESVEFQAIMEVAKELGRNVQDWTQTSGIMVYSPEAREPAAVGGTDKPELALRYLLRNRRSSIAVMRGLAPFTTQPLYRRLLRDFELKADGERDCMILMDEVALHPLVQRLCTPWRPGLPDKDELEDLVKQTYRRLCEHDNPDHQAFLPNPSGTFLCSRWFALQEHSREYDGDQPTGPTLQDLRNRRRPDRNDGCPIEPQLFGIQPDLNYDQSNETGHDRRRNKEPSE